MKEVSKGAAFARIDAKTACARSADFSPGTVFPCIRALAWRRAPATQGELSYANFRQEVPPPPQPGFQGLVIALRIGLPSFVQPRQGPAKATLVWNAELSKDNTIRLKVENPGTGHIQISTVELFHPQDKEPIAEQSGLTYVLPGQSRECNLKLRSTRAKMRDHPRIKVSTDAG